MKWTKYHDKEVLNLYYEVKGITGKELKEIVKEFKKNNKKFTCSTDSILKRLSNIQYVDIGKGLPHASKPTIQIYNKYKKNEKKM